MIVCVYDKCSGVFDLSIERVRWQYLREYIHGHVCLYLNVALFDAYATHPLTILSLHHTI